MSKNISIKKTSVLNFLAQRKMAGESLRVEIVEHRGVRSGKNDKKKFLLELKHEIDIYGKEISNDEVEVVLAHVELAVGYHCSGLDVKNDENAKSEINDLRDRVVPYSISKINSMLTDIGVTPLSFDSFYVSESN